jgi:hypothetical protein
MTRYDTALGLVASLPSHFSNRFFIACFITAITTTTPAHIVRITNLRLRQSSAPHQITSWYTFNSVVNPFLLGWKPIPIVCDRLRYDKT